MINFKGFLVVLMLGFVIVVLVGLMISGFNGGYDVFNWLQVLDIGIIDVLGVFDLVMLISSNVGGGVYNIDFIIVVLGIGLVSFSWFYNIIDVDGLGFDLFGWLLNGVFI